MDWKECDFRQNGMWPPGVAVARRPLEPLVEVQPLWGLFDVFR